MTPSDNDTDNISVGNFFSQHDPRTVFRTLNNVGFAELGIVSKGKNFGFLIRSFIGTAIQAVYISD